MKKLISLVVCIVMCLSSTGNINGIEENDIQLLHEKFNKNDIVTSSDGKSVVFLTRWNNESDGFAYFFDENGVLFKTITHTFLEAVVKCDDYVYMYYEPADYENNYFRLEKLDFSGNVIWTNTYTLDSNQENHEDTFMIEANNSKIFVAGSSNSHYKMWIINKDGGIEHEVVTEETGNSYRHPSSAENGVSYRLTDRNHDTEEIIHETRYFLTNDGVLSKSNDDSLYDGIEFNSWIDRTRMLEADKTEEIKNTLEVVTDDYNFGYRLGDETAIFIQHDRSNDHHRAWILGGLDLDVKYEFDVNVSNKIYQALGIYGGDLTKDELQTLKVLDLSYSGLDSAVGLEQLKNLESLDLSFNDLVDISPILKLENLMKLVLTGNEDILEEQVKELADRGVAVIRDVIIEDNNIGELIQVNQEVSEIREDVENYIEGEIDELVMDLVISDVSGVQDMNLKAVDAQVKALKDASYQGLVSNGVELDRYLDVEAEIEMSMDDSMVLRLDDVSQLEALDQLRLSDASLDIVLDVDEVGRNGEIGVEEAIDYYPEEVNLADTLVEDGLSGFYKSVLIEGQRVLLEKNESYSAMIDFQSNVVHEVEYNKYSIQMNDSGPIIIGLNYEDSYNDSIVRTKGDGFEVVGGKVNPESGKLEVRIEENGDYYVMNNRISVDDVSGYDPEEQVIFSSLLSKNILKEGQDGFNPEDEIDRDELTFAVMRLMGRMDFEAAASFTDVDEGNPYYHYISTSESMGMINGFEDGTFRPKDSMLNAQLVKVMSVALMVEKGYRFTPAMNDYLEQIVNSDDLDDWARPYIAFGMREGFVQLDGDMHYFGNDVLLRSHAAKLLYELYLRL